jgi:hypothetical protein
VSDWNKELMVHDWPEMGPGKLSLEDLYQMFKERMAHENHPDYGTPNWCPVCSPAGVGYCRCEIASNE